MFKRKGNILLPFVSAIAVLAFVAAGYFFWQNQELIQKNLDKTGSTPNVIPTSQDPTAKSETANWKTYRNTKLGFEFKYPSNYSLGETTISNPIYIQSPLNSTRTKGYELQNGELKIEIYNAPKKANDSPEKCYKDYSGGEQLGQESISIGGITTTIYQWRGHGDGQSLCLISGNNRFMISKYPIQTTRQDEFMQILSTFKFTTDKEMKSDSVPTLKNSKQLTYSLPFGWSTIKDSSGEIEVGYDPAVTDVQSDSPNLGVRITGKWQYNPVKKLGGDYSAYIGSYDGGSRHTNLHKAIGLSSEMLAANQWKHPSYHEKEYSYNDWSCLVIIGVDISQYPQIWGICPTSSSKAVYITAGGLEDSVIEQFIKTIKVLK